MNERIRLGDLVRVVRWPCCGRFVGTIFKVTDMGVFPDSIQCGPRGGGCMTEHAVSMQAWACDDSIPDGTGRCKVAPVAWLKRIPPLSELESTETNESVPA